MLLNRILEGITISSLGIGTVALLIANFAFNSEDFYHDDKVGIEFGMKMDVVSQESFAWIRAPPALYIKSTFKNILISNNKGGQMEADLKSLFPMSGTKYGIGEIKFEIFAAYDDEMPDLSKHDQNIIPFAYLSEKSRFPLIQQYFLIGFAKAAQHWTLVKIGILMLAVGCILIGFTLRYLNRKISDPVIDIKE